MPTDTFMKLSQEKKDKIVSAAKKEFSRVPFEETSIKNIVEEAKIARGSFYQYFESKEELLQYIMQTDVEKINKEVTNSFERSKGDIFEVFLSIYDYMVNEIFEDREEQFHKRIFENLKTSQDSFFPIKILEPPERIKQQWYTKINLEQLNITEEQDLEIILRMLYVITKKALVSNFKYESKEKARQEYRKQIEYLKFGIQKSKGGNHV